MDRRRPLAERRFALRGTIPQEAALSDPVYRDLVASLFTMRLPILGFGILYVFVSTLILLRWSDGVIFALMGCAILVTSVRMRIISAYHRAGGELQPVRDLKAWESRYASLSYIMALLLAALNIRVLMVHEPLIHIATISLVFTFGAGVVSRTAFRPTLCATSLILAVVPTALAMLVHAATHNPQPLHSEFFVLLALLLVAVMVMSLDSVRFVYAQSLEHLVSKHDLAKLARFDTLTGLANRLMLRESFIGLVKGKPGDRLAVHCLDLDGFKAVNDQHGHPVGDELLKEVAVRLLSSIRADDVAARLGGDEFVLVQTQVELPDQAELLARRVIRKLSEPYLLDGVEVRISVSIGIALTTDLGTDLDRLLACADGALYRSKARGKCQFQFCDTDDARQDDRSAA